MIILVSIRNTIRLYDFEESHDFMESRDWAATFLTQSFVSYLTLMLFMLDFQGKIVTFFYAIFFFCGVFVGTSSKDELFDTNILFVGRMVFMFSGSALCLQWLLYKYKGLYN